MFLDSKVLLLFLLYVNSVRMQVIEKPTGVTGSCNTEVTGSSSGFIASPDFPLNDYPNNVKCVYEIVAPQPNQVIGYRSIYMSLEAKDDDTNSCYDHVTIYRSPRTNADVFCGGEVIASDVTIGPRLRVEFFSDESISSGGFALSWFALDRVQLKPSLNCNFDGFFPLCGGWRQIETDGFDWTFRRGETPSGETGPYADHTTGEMDVGRYAHIEATGVGRGSTAVLLSPTLYSDEEYCLEFWYHMLGDGLPQLNIIELTNSNEGIVLQEISAVNHQNWTRFQRTLNPTFLNISIAFEAVRGNNFRSDLAIDDVSFSRGVCGAMVTGGSCMADEFQCSNPDDGCIAKSFRCDGTRDCSDGSDEVGCTTLPRECPSNLIYSTCAPSCNRTCDDGLVGNLCSDECVARCVCPSDFPILHNDTCIDRDKCPGNDPMYQELAIQNVQEKFTRLFNHITNWIKSQKHQST